MDCSPPGSSAHGIFQARIPEWIAISYSRGFTSLPVSKWAFIKYVLDNGLPWWLSGKEFACNAGNLGSILEMGRSPGEGEGLENLMDGVLAGKISWTVFLPRKCHAEEPGGLQFMGLQKSQTQISK